MSIADVFASGEHKSNLGHFASIVNLAVIDGAINSDEELILKKLAKKLGIVDSEYSEIISNPGSFQMIPPISKSERLEKLYDFFKIIYSDHVVDDEEMGLLKKHACALGFSEEDSHDVIEKSLKIFGGQISFDDYEYLIYK